MYICHTTHIKVYIIGVYHYRKQGTAWNMRVKLIDEVTTQIACDLLFMKECIDLSERSRICSGKVDID